MKEQIELLQDIISERRSLKPADYTGETVDDQLIQQILAQANWAPSHGYTEPWRFVVYKGEALKRLGQFLANYDQADPSAEGFNAMRYERKLSSPQQASHIIGIAYLPGTNPKIPEVEEICATAMAVQNMWLMAHTLGLGSYWSTGKAAFSPELRDYMGFDERHKPLGLFYIGKPNRDNPQGRRISGIEAKVRWED